MSKEKQIEEMAEAIFQNCNCGLFFSEAEKIARFVIEEQGYRKQSEVKDILNQRIANQREEIKRLKKCLNDITQSRNYWKSKANSIGKQLQQVLYGKRKEDEGK